GIDEASITLNRYSDGSWNGLPTESIGSDDNYLYFEARTPGFSPFAITGKSSIQQNENIAEGDTLPGKGPKVNEISLPEEKPGTYNETSAPDTITLVCAGFTGLVLTITYFLRRIQQN
ncbi:MAG: PGF-pre-PGF domain-containing protein, partial [Methanosarcinaceae archaeon]|nr:PGF-pre-PGF domain-containing protein [Methanosarcinaceae archaeon]